MESLTYFAEANGPIFLTLFAVLSVTILTLIVWKALRNRNTRTPHDFYERIQAELERGDFRKVHELAQNSPGDVPQLYVAAVENMHRGKTATRNALFSLIELEMVPRQNFLLPWILFIAKVSPMCGLLGTVWGMILAFGKIAGATKVNPSDLANDIGMALFTTAEGLVLAMIAILAYTVFKEHAQQSEIDLELRAEEALSLLFQRKP